MPRTAEITIPARFEVPGAPAPVVIPDDATMSSLDALASAPAPVITSPRAKAPATDATALLASLNPGERAALLAQVAQLIASDAVRAGVAPAADPVYPDQDSIDPATLPPNSAVRVAQGWLVSSASDPRVRR